METTTVFPNADVRGFVCIDPSSKRRRRGHVRLMVFVAVADADANLLGEKNIIK
jgi:hypothetical protein